ncbi:unnamed protein product [Absidia cylindrospora]
MNFRDHQKLCGQIQRRSDRGRTATLSQTRGISLCQHGYYDSVQFSKDQIGINLDDNHYSVEALYPQHKDDFRDAEALQIQDFLVKRDKLVVEEMQLLDQLDKVQNKVAQLHSQTIRKYQENQQLWMSLEAIQQRVERQAAQQPVAQSQSQAHSVSTQYSTERLHDVLNRLEIAKNVLMGLILESNIDWASDRKWSRVMVLIGTEEDD